MRSAQVMIVEAEGETKNNTGGRKLEASYA